VKRLFAIVFALLTSCSAPSNEAPPAPQQPAQAQQQPQAPQPAALSQRCTNARDGFTVSYPAGWHTNGPEVIAACSAFDPEPVQIPPQSEIPFGLAIVISVQEVPFDRPADPQFERTLSSERLTVAGRPAVRAELESTGEGLADRGMRTLRYTIDLGAGRSLVASTNKTDAAYDANKEILARMVETIAMQ